jgi:hypothetical protein
VTALQREREKTISMSLAVPESLRFELYAAWQEVLAGEPVRLRKLHTDVELITERALTALRKIEQAIRESYIEGPGYRLTAFLASLYNGYEYPFDPCEFRDLDVVLTTACLDYLNFDRLGLGEVQEYLRGGEDQLQRWITHYQIRRPRFDRDRDRDQNYEEPEGTESTDEDDV